MATKKAAATPETSTDTSTEATPLDTLCAALECVCCDAPHHPDPREMVKQLAAALLVYMKTPD